MNVLRSCLVLLGLLGAAALADGVTLPAFERVVLENGTVLLLNEKHDVPLVGLVSTMSKPNCSNMVLTQLTREFHAASPLFQAEIVAVLTCRMPDVFPAAFSPPRNIVQLPVQRSRKIVLVAAAAAVDTLAVLGSILM